MLNTLRPRLLTLGAVLAFALASPAVPARAQDTATRSVVVHGHWTIDVRNPDGTLVERREFDNALLTNGPPILASVLARRFRAGPWSVKLSGPGNEGPCGPGPFGLSTCYLFEPATSQVNPDFFFHTLAVDSPQSGANAGRVVLTGRGIATSTVGNPRITSVTTEQVTCEVANLAQCVFTNDSPRGDFSGTTIPALSVVKGQIIQVTVILSFQ